MSSAASTSRPVDTSFIRSRLGSLLAVAPLSIWTVNHLWNNLAAFQGAEAWQTSVTEYSHPLAFFASSLIALLPLALHTIWGLGRLKSARPNIDRYRYFGNLRYILQRLSAVGVLLFLGAHLWLAMLKPRLTTGKPEMFADIAGEMHHHLPTLLVYTLGVLGVSYHLANGLNTFAMGWGLATSRRALKKVDLLVWVVFLGLLAMGWGAVYALWDAGGQLPPPADH
ncbi:MAG: succinate dehydrogenase [Labilithrix sp.]|nr:succinate dehydrogenase [Labilithrix sp.]